MHGQWYPGLGQPLIEELTGDESRQESYTWNIVWSDDGTAYIGRDHLWKWDGANLSKVGSVSFGALRGMDIDAEGMLWLAGFNRFGIYDPSTDSFESRMPWLPEKYRQFGEAWIVHHDGQAVWLGTDRRLFRITEAGSNVWEFGSEHRVIFHFLHSGIFAHETGVGLWKIQGDQKMLVNSDPRLAAKSVLFLEEQKDGSFIAVSGRGVMKLSGANKITSIEFADKIEKLQISSANKVGGEYIALGTLESGVYLLNYRSKQFFELSGINTLLPKIVLNLKTDPLGNLVICEMGVWIVRFSISAGTSRYFDDEVSGFIRSCIYKSSHFYTNNGKGLFSHTVNSQFNGSFIIIDKLFPGEILELESFGEDIVFDRYDSLYKCSSTTPQLLHDFGRVISAWGAGPDEMVYVAFPSRLEVYGANTDGGLEVLAGGEVMSNLQELDVDGRGHAWGWAPNAPLMEAWLDAAGGLQVREHAVAGGRLLAESDWRLAVTEPGPVLVFADRLMRWNSDGQRWEGAVLGGMEDLPEAYSFQALGEGLEGWLVGWDSRERLYRVYHVSWSEASRVEVRNLPWPDMRCMGAITQIQPVDHPGIGYVIAGSEGLFLAGKELPEQIPPPERPELGKLQGSLRRAGANTFKFGREPVRVEIHARDAGSSYPLKFQTRLAADEAWGEPMAMGSREFGPLVEGEYRLEVRAVDPFGRRSEAAVVEFRILPPWYRSVGGYAAFVFLILLCIGIPIRIRYRSLKLNQARLEREVAERTAELRTAIASKDTFIANLSHEVRNPLNGIIGMIQQMKEGVVPPPRYLKGLRGAARYLQATVEDVLDFSKLQSGKIELEQTLIDIGEVAEGVVEIYREQAREHELEFLTTIDVPEHTGIVSDSRKVQQLIGNLVGNAVKFTESGRVFMNLVLQADGGTRGQLILSVTDTGPGISEDDRERIFEKFYQVRENASGPTGTGIGLSLVKAYTEMMGGKIELESQPGLGSTFTIRLPVEVRPLDDKPPVPDGVVLEKPLQVLVVEDVEYNRIVMEDMLTGLGCKVDSAENGADGVALALKGIHDVIFLDWELPDMNGVEIATELIRNGQLAQHARIIALTAHATENIREQCLQAGMNDFLTKPVNQEQIVRILKESLPIDEPDDEADLPEANDPTNGSLIRSLGNLAVLAEDKGWKKTHEQFNGFLQKYLGELEEAFASGDAERVRQSAHRFLGFLRMIEVNILPELLQGIQDAAREGDLATARIHWTGFRERVKPLKDELREKVRGLTS